MNRKSKLEALSSDERYLWVHRNDKTINEIAVHLGISCNQVRDMLDSLIERLGGC